MLTSLALAMLGLALSSEMLDNVINLNLLLVIIILYLFSLTYICTLGDGG